MRTLIIFRHARPKAYTVRSLFSILRGSEISNFLKILNESELTPFRISNKARVLIKQSNAIYLTSELKRAKDTWKILGVENTFETELLNEPNLPSGILKQIYLPIFAWGILLKLIWIFGGTTNTESFRHFRRRMETAANYLDNLCSSDRNVYVMGHTFVNLYLVRALKERGWKTIEKRGLLYLSYRRLGK
jgi:broad specificity phosphatase PhoE